MWRRRRADPASGEAGRAEQKAIQAGTHLSEASTSGRCEVFTPCDSHQQNTQKRNGPQGSHRFLKCLREENCLPWCCTALHTLPSVGPWWSRGEWGSGMFFVTCTWSCPDADGFRTSCVLKVPQITLLILKAFTACCFEPSE